MARPASCLSTRLDRFLPLPPAALRPVTAVRASNPLHTHVLSHARIKSTDSSIPNTAEMLALLNWQALGLLGWGIRPPQSLCHLGATAPFKHISRDESSPHPQAPTLISKLAVSLRVFSFLKNFAWPVPLLQAFPNSLFGALNCRYRETGG